MIFLPPRHGKSELVSRYFPAWFLANYPDKRVVLASYEATFAASWGEKARDALLLANEHGLTATTVKRGRSAVDNWGIEGREGGMFTAGVGGALTGRGFDVGIIDDPVKNQEEAQSPTYRQKAWDWYNTTFATRAQNPQAATIVIQTRWHSDDLSGRILAAAVEPWEVIVLPAYAEPNDPLGRAEGEPLWPSQWPREALEVKRKEGGSHWWAAMYQQRPVPREGGFFKQDWFNTVPVAPATVTSRVRYWDKAATAGGGDYTVGVLMSRTAEGLFTVEDVQRGQWDSGAAKKIVLQTAARDGRTVPIAMEQEPGSSGKDVIADYRAALVGYTFRGVPATGSKQLRADPLASQAEGRNVVLVEAPWNGAFIDELCAFDKAEHDDQVDAASGAFAVLAKPGTVSTVYV